MKSYKKLNGRERAGIEHWTYYGYERHLSGLRRATTRTATASICAAILSPLSRPLSDKGKPLYRRYVQLGTLVFLLHKHGR